MRKAPGWTIVTMAALVGLGGCGGGGSSADRSGADDAIKAARVVARADAFSQPLDGAPSPDGTVIYYTTTGDHGPAVLSVAAGGGSPKALAEGAPLAKPFGVAVATDNSRVYIADQGAQPAVAGAAAGAILAVPVAGSTGAPAPVPGTETRAPRGLDVVRQGDGDVVYFTGTDPANGAVGLFQVPAAGGTVTTVAEGSPFVSPDSVVVTAQGLAYVSDQGSGPGHGEVFRVSGGTVTPVLTDLHLGAPAGVTLTGNDATLLVSSIDAATTSDQVLSLDLATGKTSATTKVIGDNKNSSGGLHRAHNVPVLAWADVSRSGRVYRVEI